MKTYRIEGLDEIEVMTQIDIKAYTKDEARFLAKTRYGLKTIANIEEIDY